MIWQVKNHRIWVRHVKNHRIRILTTANSSRIWNHAILFLNKMVATYPISIFIEYLYLFQINISSFHCRPLRVLKVLSQVWWIQATKFAHFCRIWILNIARIRILSWFFQVSIQIQDSYCSVGTWECKFALVRILSLWTGSGSWPQNKPDPTFTRIKLKKHRKILGKFFRSVYYLLKFHNLNNANTRIVPKYFSILR